MQQFWRQFECFRSHSRCRKPTFLQCRRGILSCVPSRTCKCSCVHMYRQRHHGYWQFLHNSPRSLAYSATPSSILQGLHQTLSFMIQNPSRNVLNQGRVIHPTERQLRFLQRPSVNNNKKQAECHHTSNQKLQHNRSQSPPTKKVVTWGKIGEMVHLDDIRNPTWVTVSR